MARLAEMGHTVRPVAGADRYLSGSGQIIRRNTSTGVLFWGAGIAHRRAGHPQIQGRDRRLLHEKMGMYPAYTHPRGNDCVCLRNKKDDRR